MLKRLQVFNQIVPLLLCQSQVKTSILAVDHIGESLEPAMVKAALAMCEQPSKWRRTVTLFAGTAFRLKIIYSHFARSMEFYPGSVNNGTTWQVEHFALLLNSCSPRVAASPSKLPSGGVGAGSESW
jgi:hypothetical protein